MLSLQLLSNPIYSVCLQLTGAIQVRIHANLRYKLGAWIELWYQLRAIDIDGSGKFELRFKDLCRLLKKRGSTVYQLLREGRAQGGLRKYSVSRGVVKGYLSSLINVCLANDLDSWGAVSHCPAKDLKDELKLTTIATITAFEQSKARYTFGRSFKNHQRRGAFLFSVDNAIRSDISFSSQKPVDGARELMLGIDDRYLYGTKSLLVFGTTQNTIADSLGVSTRTVQRYQQDIDHRQVAITRPEYKTAIGIINHGEMSIGEYRHISEEVAIRKVGAESYQLLESLPGTNTRSVTNVCSGSFFKGWFNRFYCAKNNIYRLDDLPKLERMIATKRKYRALRGLEKAEDSHGIRRKGDLSGGKSTDKQNLLTFSARGG